MEVRCVEFLVYEAVSPQCYYCMMFIFCSDDIRTMFKVIRYSEKGSNEREREEAAYMYFVDYLDDCEKGRKSIIPNNGKICSIHCQCLHLEALPPCIFGWVYLPTSQCYMWLI